MLNLPAALKFILFMVYLILVMISGVAPIRRLQRIRESLSVAGFLLFSFFFPLLFPFALTWHFAAKIRDKIFP